ncbi:MAG: nitrilotriacetate monooxygenase [Modestobacter sp.]|jgi:FMN-dependent oxidoreductase (nitrilotriacetate monooxygenase family)|nr:nitrilotriacetate monooxygenase [Modestobacter sp.]
MTPDTSPQMHLSLNLSEYGRHAGAWRHPDNDYTVVPDIGRYVHAAQVAEGALFDSVFLADSPQHATTPSGITSTRVDPFAVLSAIAVETHSVGLIGTMSTSYSEPYTVARRVAALDHLSHGRAAVNCVASAGDRMARNFSLVSEHPHAQRYSRTEEHLTLMAKLWDSAGTADSAPRPVDHHGEFFDVTGSLDIPRPPAGRPVIVQAGNSPEGRAVAGRWAEAIFAGSTTMPHAQEYYRDVKAQTAGAGRDPDHIKILLGVFPYIADTETAAQALKAELDEYHREHADTIGHLSAILGLDLSTYDPEGPLPYADLPTPGQGNMGGWSMATLFPRMAREEGLTLGQIADRAFVGGLSNLQWSVVGTGEQVAAELERWFRAGCCDGFAIVAPMTPKTIEDMAQQVVPELQRTGVFRTEYTGSTIRDHLGLPPVLGLPTAALVP